MEHEIMCRPATTNKFKKVINFKKTIQVTLLEFKDSETFIADEHPIVNDDDYCEVITTLPRLTYECDGVTCAISGSVGETKSDLVGQIIPKVLFDTWYEDNWTKTFEEIGLDNPIYDSLVIKGVDDFISNCKRHVNYDIIIGKIISIANSEYEVVVFENSEQIYPKPLSREEQRLKKLLSNVECYKEGKRDLSSALSIHSRICFNDIPSRNLDCFADGWTKDISLNLFNICCKVVFNNDQKALLRLKIDLGVVEPNFTIKEVI